MTAMRNLAADRPMVFVVTLFLVESLLAVPFVVAFRVLGLEIEPLRLVIPTAQSVFMIWVVWSLGSFTKSGFTTTARDVHLYAYPVLLAFAPTLVYGTIAVPPGPLVFYTLALVATGVSEETLGRGVVIPALLPKGKWIALLTAGLLFSLGHLSNLAFEDFDVLEMGGVLLNTFGFAILYGAVFLRTRCIWPLIVLHTIHDYAYVTSGTAGPFTTEPISQRLTAVLAVLNIAYGALIVRRVEG